MINGIIFVLLFVWTFGSSSSIEVFLVVERSTIFLRLTVSAHNSGYTPNFDGYIYFLLHYVYVLGPDMYNSIRSQSARSKC